MGTRNSVFWGPYSLRFIYQVNLSFYIRTCYIFAKIAFLVFASTFHVRIASGGWPWAGDGAGSEKWFHDGGDGGGGRPQPQASHIDHSFGGDTCRCTQTKVCKEFWETLQEGKTALTSQCWTKYLFLVMVNVLVKNRSLFSSKSKAAPANLQLGQRHTQPNINFNMLLFIPNYRVLPSTTNTTFDLSAFQMRPAIAKVTPIYLSEKVTWPKIEVVFWELLKFLNFLLKILTLFDNFDKFQQCWQILTVLTISDNF